MSNYEYDYDDDDIIFTEDGIIVCHMILFTVMLALGMIGFIIIS